MKAYLLLTAMPPTTGHWQLIKFASKLAPEGVHVIVCTQPHEPFPKERVQALRQAVKNHRLKHITITHFDKVIEQNPKAPGFKAMWRDLMIGFGATSQDIIVASESYGQWLAESIGAQFFPYDVDRILNNAKATPIRDNPLNNFGDILPEFQPYLQTRVTIFGAESTGKTTLSRQLAASLDGHWLYEYARPYLEETVNEITTRSMTAIWRGQSALQRQTADLPGKPYIIQDTDLFSTVGYWQFPHWQSTIGSCPEGLITEALDLRSDLYIVTRSNIPFEQDPLRYGGTVREGSDAYWIDLLRRYNLPYIVLDDPDPAVRLRTAKKAVLAIGTRKAALLSYNRNGW